MKKKGGNINKIQQIRTEKEDHANTILKMAEKRAVTSVTLRVTAASDSFDQMDYEDGNGANSNANKDHPKDVSMPSPKGVGCDHPMTEPVREFSTKKYGHPLCMDCQKGDTND